RHGRFFRRCVCHRDLLSGGWAGQGGDGTLKKERDQPPKHFRSLHMANQLVAGRSGMLATAAMLAVLACTVAGCSSTTPPGLDVVDVTIGEETPQAMVLVFSLQGSNTNEFPLPLGEVRYELDLAGERVFEGVRSAQ